MPAITKPGTIMNTVAEARRATGQPAACLNCVGVQSFSVFNLDSSAGLDLASTVMAPLPLVARPSVDSPMEAKMKHEIRAYPTIGDARDGLRPTLQANMPILLQLHQNTEEQDRAYRDATGFDQKCIDWQTRPDGPRTPIAPDLFHLPDDEMEIAHKEAGSGLRLYCVIRLGSAERDSAVRQFDFSYQVDPNLAPHRGKGMYDDIPSLIGAINTMLDELEGHYLGARFIPVFFTAEEEDKVSQAQAAAAFSFVVFMNAQHDSPRLDQRLLDGVSVGSSVDGVTIGGFSPDERSAFLKEYGAGRVIEVEAE